jgi:hypothetical protein
VAIVPTKTRNKVMKIKTHTDLKEGIPRWESNWNDTLANKMTKKGNIVLIETVSRYGKDTEWCLTLDKFDSWRQSILGQSSNDQKMGD